MADVLTYNSSAYVKNYGRATLSTVSIRGTSSSHTGTTWNGMRIASPMLGTTDFSMIPAYFIDDARVKTGASSVGDTGGALGGIVKLTSSARNVADGFSGQYVQGAGSWLTFDEFLRLGFGKNRLKTSLRASFSSSRNDFTYINREKKENVYDSDHNIISSYYPRERNRSGAFRDFHAMAGVAYDAATAGLWSADVWVTSSDRELPMLMADYSNKMEFENKQRENTVRAVGSWQRFYARHTLTAKIGYIYSQINYDHWRQVSVSATSTIAKSRTEVNSFFGSFDWRFTPSVKWFFNVRGDVYHHRVSSFDYAAIAIAPPGYAKHRTELSAVAEAKWRPSWRWGLGATVRQELYGTSLPAPIPALYAEAVLVRSIDLTARLTGSRNYRFPTLNDLYTIPGGNPDLRPERGLSYDAALSASIPLGESSKIALSAGWFDSHITDWIMWLPSPKGFYVPRNAKRVRSQGVETEAAVELKLPRTWCVDAAVNYSYTSSRNLSDPINASDKSYGKQLPYIPVHSVSGTLRAGWRRWALSYRVQAYSERFTMSSNEVSLSGRLPAYSVSNLALDRSFTLWKLEWLAKVAINNLFNADYQTVLSRPMPGINFEFFLSLTW